MNAFTDSQINAAYLVWFRDLKPIRTLVSSLAVSLLIACVVIEVWFPSSSGRHAAPAVARDAILAFFALACVPLVFRAIFSPAELRERPFYGTLTTQEAVVYGCVGGVIAGVSQIVSNLWIVTPHGTTQATIVIVVASVPCVALANALIFQGWLQTRLADRLGPMPAVIVTVALCVLLFGRGNLREAVSWFTGTLVLSLLRMKTGSLFACIIASAVGDLCYIAAFSAHIV